MTINIGSRGETETERMLSNFANTPFVLHSKVYASIEGFWQSLKFPEEKRGFVARLWGTEARRAGREVPQAEYFRYNNLNIRVGSPEHHALMRAALRAKFRQNPAVLKLLLQTGNEPITHILYGKDGKQLPDSKTIPSEVFCRILMDLRSEYRAIHGDGSHILV